MDLIQVYVKYNLYETLELTIDATTNDIKKKYKKLAIKFHPDKYLNSDELSDDEKQTLQTHFNLVNIAYDILSNDETRVTYDKARKEYVDAGQFFDLKKQFNHFEFNYENKDSAKKTFQSENDKAKETNEKLAEEIRENTKKNLNKTFEIQRVDNFDELMNESNKEVKKEYLNKFNNLFDNMRQKTNKSTEIIEYNAADNFSSLDNAFNILEVSDKDYVDSGMTIEQRMAAYNNEFNNLKLPEPTNKTLPKFNNSSFDFEKNKFN
jgi:curved DNA-binding protein CbpA